MNREIKFRGKSTINGNIVSGNYCFIFGGHRINIDYRSYPVHPWSVEQFTGLLDKNGTEIYEGDILDNNEKVNFEGGCFYAGGTPLCLSNSHRSIIGNIHDNPELI